jgi:hypothetical protein
VEAITHQQTAEAGVQQAVQQPELWLAVVRTTTAEAKLTKSQKKAPQRAVELAAATAAEIRRLRSALVQQLSSTEHARRLALVSEQYIAHKQSITTAAAVVTNSP